MKKLLILLPCMFGVMFAAAQARAVIDSKTGIVTVKAELADHYSVIGFAAPDTRSQKLILFSVFPNEVKDNPQNLPLGAYHETINLKPGERIEYDSEAGNFVRLNFIKADNSVTPFYLGRSFVKIK